MVQELLLDRGLKVDRSTIYRWVQEYANEINKRVRGLLKPTNDSWKLDEMYVKVNGKNFYLYRAIDSNGDTIDFLLCEHRNKKAAKRFLKKAMSNKNSKKPRVINSDKDKAIESAIKRMKKDEDFYKDTSHRPIKYLNNLIEQDHRFIRKIIRPMLGFKSFETATKTIVIIETMHMIHKVQVKDYFKNYKNDQDFINQLFEIDKNDRVLKWEIAA